MAIHLSLRHHPLLASLTSDQRQQVIRTALARLTGWRQVSLNLYKVLLLVPPFLLLARHPGLMTLLVTVIWLLLYPVLLRPLQLWLVADLLPSALASLNQQAPAQQSEEEDNAN
ncbi:MAG: hypothetical protein II007_06935 [Gammaproteobacteria bacterium]|nr:hypothetical protein [Gammaproteobacteria bacterium]